jgi:hypothetical protein
MPDFRGCRRFLKTYPFGNAEGITAKIELAAPTIELVYCDNLVR